MNRLTRTPSPGTVIAILALVVALGGNAIADQVQAVIAKLKPNSVTSATVKNGSLLLKDFKAGERAKLAGSKGDTGPQGPQGPQGPAGAAGGYTKTEADAHFLTTGGLAANADNLDGLDSGSFVQGGGTASYGIVSKSATLAGTGGSVLNTIPKLGEIFVSCTLGSPNSGTVQYSNTTSGAINLTSSVTHSGSATIVGNTVIPAGNSVQFASDTVPTQMVLQPNFQTGGGPLLSSNAAATILLTDIPDPSGAAGTCRFQSKVFADSKNGIGLVVQPLG
jgi:hypothetical protein